LNICLHTLQEKFEIMHYTPGGCFTMHDDNTNLDDESVAHHGGVELDTTQRNGANRLYTVLFYFNGKSCLP
jgi:hypothetical protein